MTRLFESVFLSLVLLLSVVACSHQKQVASNELDTVQDSQTFESDEMASVETEEATQGVEEQMAQEMAQDEGAFADAGLEPVEGGANLASNTDGGAELTEEQQVSDEVSSSEDSEISVSVEDAADLVDATTQERNTATLAMAKKEVTTQKKEKSKKIEIPVMQPTVASESNAFVPPPAVVAQPEVGRIISEDKTKKASVGVSDFIERNFSLLLISGALLGLGIIAFLLFDGRKKDSMDI